MSKLVSCEVTPVCENALRFDDDAQATFYLVIGATHGVVIDTGMGAGELLPVLRQYTNLPLALLMTHGHGDHMYHADEFDTVYLSRLDLPQVLDACARMGIDKSYDLEHFHDLAHGAILRFGDIRLRVLGLGGHTPGSVAFHDETHNLLFTGDALGSGCGVWMQTPGSIGIAQYQSNLERAAKVIEPLPQEPLFLPGHYSQRYFEGGDNPVNLALLRDMATLCGQLLAGDARTEPAPEYIKTSEPPLLARHGRASMIYTASKLKGESHATD